MSESTTILMGITDVTVALDAIDDIIATISDCDGHRDFSPVRYPYTYGWDYVRDHARDFGWDSMPSRSQVSTWAHDTFKDAGANKIARRLADAYLRENNILRRTGVSDV